MVGGVGGDSANVLFVDAVSILLKIENWNKEKDRKKERKKK